MLRWYSKIAKNRGYNDSKTISLLFFFWPTLLHDHAASRLVKRVKCIQNWFAVLAENTLFIIIQNWIEWPDLESILDPLLAAAAAAWAWETASEPLSLAISSLASDSCLSNWRTLESNCLSRLSSTEFFFFCSTKFASNSVLLSVRVWLMSVWAVNKVKYALTYVFQLLFYPRYARDKWFILQTF